MQRLGSQLCSCSGQAHSLSGAGSPGVDGATSASGRPKSASILLPSAPRHGPRPSLFGAQAASPKPSAPLPHAWLPVLAWSIASTVACRQRHDPPPRAAPSPAALVDAPTLPAPWPPATASLALPQEGGGVLLPPDLADAVGERLAQCDELPGLAAVAIAEQAAQDDARLREAVETMGAQCDRYVAVIETEAEGWAWWEVGLIAGGAGAAGVVLGLIVGLIAGDGGPVVVTP